MNFIGKDVGNYHLIAAISSGAYGSVYRANHTILSERIVAVKLLHTYLDSDKERENFLGEARLLAKLNHQYILPIHDVGFTDGLPYIVVEYAPKGSLRDRLKQQAGRPLPTEEVRKLLMQIGQALEHAHQQNVIHRDLKPENILFNAQGEALLSDFGIATVVDTSMRQTGIIGTPTYMAPEQFQGMVSKEVDQYALGCLAYELYTGRKVFEAPDFLAMAVQHTTKAPTPPKRYNAQLPDHIERAILRALAKKRTDRYPSISAFLQALNSAPVSALTEEQSIPPAWGSDKRDVNLIGKDVGNYRLVAAINSGAYGSVYRANHRILSERIVAVKLLHTHLDSDKERENFLGEARLLAKLNHQYILPIHDVGFTDGLPYIVVEYAPKGSLRDRLKQQAGRPLPTEEARRLLIQIGQALEHAHQQNVIHRDLKPENILFNAQGEALLSDFGIATVVDTSMKQTGIIGTPTYMAPEQFQGMVSKEVDQYALGCLAYELYTGRKVFEAPDFLSMAVQHTTKAPTPPTHYNPQVPGNIERAILRALAKERTDRYPSISAFLQALSSAPVSVSSSVPTEEQSLPPTIPSGIIAPKSWLSEGVAHLSFNRPQEALAVFEQILRLTPTNVAALIGKGRSLAALERFEEAEQAFQEVMRLEPGNSSHRKVLGEIQTQVKQNEEARSASSGNKKEKVQTAPKKSTVQEPANKAASLFKQGNILTTSKQYEQAMEAFAEAVRLEPGNADYQNGRGRAFYNLKRYEQALGAFKEAARLAPKVSNHLRWQGEALYQLKRYPGALEAFEKALQLDPNFGYLHKMQAEILCELKRYEEALEAFEKAARLETGNLAHRKRQEQIRAQLKQDKVASLYKQGNTHTASKQYEQALVAYREAVQLEPSNVNYQQALGRTFSSLKRHEEALEVFKEVARLQPKASAHLQMQAETLWELKRHEEALAMYEQAIRLEPLASYRKRLEEMRAQVKQNEEARSPSKKEKEQTASKKPTSQEPSKKAESLYKQGNTFTASKQYEQALVVYREAVRLQPNNANYQQALGRTFSNLQRYEEALGVFREVARLQPKISTHLQMQAELLWKLKRYEEALAMYEQAIRLEPLASYRKRLEELRAQVKPQESGLQKFLHFFRSQI